MDAPIPQPLASALDDARTRPVLAPRVGQALLADAFRQSPHAVTHVLVRDAVRFADTLPEIHRDGRAILLWSARVVESPAVPDKEAWCLAGPVIDPRHAIVVRWARWPRRKP